MDPNALNALNEFVQQDYGQGAGLAMYGQDPNAYAGQQYTSYGEDPNATGDGQSYEYYGAGAGYEGHAPPPPSEEGMAPPPPPDFDENETEDRRQTDLSNYDFTEGDSEKNFIKDAEGRLKACSFGKLISLLTAAKDNDSNLLFDFVLTYRSFATSFEVLNGLIRRYDTASGPDAKIIHLRSEKPKTNPNKTKLKLS